MRTHFRRLIVLLTAALAAGCTIAELEPPPLAGPSEMSLSLTITANPDVLSLDGSSQTLITIEARDANGQPASNVPLRVEILADGQRVDFGTISARTLVTGSNGRATFTYTAPSFVAGAIPDLQLSITPTGSDASSHVRRVVTVRLVPPGVIAGAPTAAFTFTPASPAAFTNVRFNGSTSTPGLGGTIVNYAWDFGDNTGGTGMLATHQYSAPGTYLVRLTVTDSNGISGQSPAQTIVVGAGVGPTAEFVFSPAEPVACDQVFFNGTLSTASPGHQIVSYNWNWGDGTPSQGGSTRSHRFENDGTWVVVLTVTDEAGQKSVTQENVVVSAGPSPCP